MEVALFFERRFHNQIPHPYQSQSNFQESNRKDNFAHGYNDNNTMQVAHWQAEYDKYTCNSSAPNLCLHRHSTSNASFTSDPQPYTTPWHPYNYSQDAFLSARTGDSQIYQESEAKPSLSRASYHTRQREPITTMSSTSPHFARDNNTTDAAYRSARNVQDYVPNQLAYYRTNSFGDALHEIKRDWEMSFLKSFPYRKFNIFLFEFILVLVL